MRTRSYLRQPIAKHCQIDLPDAHKTRDSKIQPVVKMAASDDASAAASPRSPASMYGTPTDSGAIAKPNEKDTQMVVSAGRSLKTMLVDLMGVLENQANAKIFIQGDITLRVDGRESYTIQLRNEDGLEPSNLKVHIDNALATTNGSLSTNKRKASDGAEVVEVAADSSKRARTEDAQPPPAPGNDDEGDGDGSEFQQIMTKFGNLSAQIKWVEECRRLAGHSHDAREEKWRSTSATFHDDNRKMLERHNMWMTAEMGWQRNMLIQLANDLKGLYPLAHSMKWETPPSMNPAPLPFPTPMLHNNNGPIGKPYTPKQPRKPAASTLKPNSNPNLSSTPKT